MVHLVGRAGDLGEDHHLAVLGPLGSDPQGDARRRVVEHGVLGVLDLAGPQVRSVGPAPAAPATRAQGAGQGPQGHAADLGAQPGARADLAVGREDSYRFWRVGIPTIVMVSAQV